MKRVAHQPGEKRGRLTYIGEAEPYVSPRGRRSRSGVFVCDCGRTSTVILSAWTNGKTATCGCTRSSHGQNSGGGRTVLYSNWMNMNHRCTDGYQERHPSYAGVRRDPRWATFEGFVANPPAGRPFEPGLVLARTGDTGDYSPENTRWATKSENTREALELRWHPPERA